MLAQGRIGLVIDPIISIAGSLSSTGSNNFGSLVAHSTIRAVTPDWGRSSPLRLGTDGVHFGELLGFG